MGSTDSSTAASHEDYMLPGFRFHPTGDELIFYLTKKAASVPLSLSIIAEVNIFKFDPWQLPAKALMGEREWYFFSRIEGPRCNRTTPSGYWKGIGIGKTLMNSRKKVMIGSKKALVFYRGKPSKGVKSNWFLDEYRLTDSKTNSKLHASDPASAQGSFKLDWVLCRVHVKDVTEIQMNYDSNDPSMSDTSDPPSSSVGQHCSELQGLNHTSFCEILEVDPKMFNFDHEIAPDTLQSEGEILQDSFPIHHSELEEFANIVDATAFCLEHRGTDIIREDKCILKKSSSISDGKYKAHIQNESSCSYETLEQHFGLKLGDAAERLGVSRSTVKRWCRDNNISRWPFPKRRNVTFFPSTSKQINEPFQGNSEPISDFTEDDDSSFDVLKNLIKKRAMSTMTIKATYMNSIIKFQLPFSSRMADLDEKVTLRLKLSEGTFTIKYLDDAGDYILIACDEDLHECIISFRNLDKTEIKMLIEPLPVTITGWE